LLQLLTVIVEYASRFPPGAAVHWVLLRMKRALLVLATAAFYVAHQDVWFWKSAEPLVLGFIPPGLAYHVVYTLGTSVLMWALVHYAWPSHLEQEVEDKLREDRTR